MVGTSDERLMNLHDALKLEFQKVQRTYQDSLEKLDALALVVGKVGKGQVDLERQLVVENKKKKIYMVQLFPSGVWSWEGSNRSESPEAAELEGGRDPGEADQEQDPPQCGGAHPGEHQFRGKIMLVLMSI